MKRQVLLALLAVLPWAGGLQAQEKKEAAAEEAAQIKTLATGLTAGKTARADKIAAVHAHVRDQIAQAPTQYG